MPRAKPLPRQLPPAAAATAAAPAAGGGSSSGSDSDDDWQPAAAAAQPVDLTLDSSDGDSDGSGDGGSSDAASTSSSGRGGGGRRGGRVLGRGRGRGRGAGRSSSAAAAAAAGSPAAPKRKHKVTAPAPPTGAGGFLRLCRLPLRAGVLVEAARRGPHRVATHGPLLASDVAAAPAACSLLLVTATTVPVGGGAARKLPPPHVYVAAGGGGGGAAVDDDEDGGSAASDQQLRRWYHAPLADALPALGPAATAGLVRLLNDRLVTVTVNAMAAAPAAGAAGSGAGGVSDADDDDDDVVLGASSLSSAAAATASSSSSATAPAAAPAGSAPLLRCSIDVFLSLAVATRFSAAHPYVPAAASKEPFKALAALLSHPLVLAAGGRFGAHNSSTLLHEPLIPYPPSAEPAVAVDDDDGGDDGAAASSPSRPGSHTHHKLHAPLSESDVYAAASPLPHEARLQRPLDVASPRLARLRAVLKPTLRGYQARGVEWMRQREAQVDDRVLRHGAAAAASGEDVEMVADEPAAGGGDTLSTGEGVFYQMVLHSPAVLASAGGADSEEAAPPAPVPTPLHPLWAQCADLDDVVFYASPLSGHVSLVPVPPEDPLGTPPPQPPPAAAASSGSAQQPPPPPAALPLPVGGILADVMGAGKTVSVLALILTTHKPHALAVHAARDDCTSASDAAARLTRLIELRDASAGDSSGGGGADDGSGDGSGGKGRKLPPASVVAGGGDDSPPRGSKGKGGGKGDDEPQRQSADEEDPTSIACICGQPYLTPLPPDVQVAVKAGLTGRRVVRADGSVDVVPITQERADRLDWVQCGGCRRWQHFLCGGYTADDAAADRPFACIECKCAVLGGRPLASAGTIIVTPPVILAQWQAEIRKHTNTVPPLPATAASAAAGAGGHADDGDDDVDRSLEVVYYAGTKATLAGLRHCVATANRLTAEADAADRALQALQLQSDGSSSAAAAAVGSKRKRGPQENAAAAAVAARAAENDDGLFDEEEDDDIVLVSQSKPGPSAAAASGAAAGYEVDDDDAVVIIDDDGYGDGEEAEEYEFEPRRRRRSGGAAGAGGKKGGGGGGKRRRLNTGAAARLSVAASTSGTPSAARGGGCFPAVGSSASDGFGDLQFDPALMAAAGEDEAAVAAASRAAGAAEQPGSAASTADDDAAASFSAAADSGSGAAAGKRGRARKSAGGPLPSPLSDGTPSASATPVPPATRAAQLTATLASLRARLAQVTATAHRLARTLQPEVLAGAHIVITTYAALQEDVHHADNSTAAVLSAGQEAGAAASKQRLSGAGLNAFLAARLAAFFAAPKRLGLFDDAAVAEAVRAGGGGGRSMRHAKKYRVVPTPLLAVAFYRAALDETQMINQPTAACAVMARRLFTWHRFCVSGTPLARGAGDLRGLLYFLGVPVYELEHVFTRLLLAPSEAGAVDARAALLRLVHALMWRTSPEDVAAELNIPPLTEETVTLRLGAIETAFYNREFAAQSEPVKPVLAAWHRDEAAKRRAARARLAAAAAKRKKDRSRAGTSAGASGGSSSAAAVSAESGDGGGDDDAVVVVDGDGGAPRPADDALALTGGQPLTKREADKVLRALLSLRQAAVHPQIGAATRKGSRGAGASGSGGGGGGAFPGRGHVLGTGGRVPTMQSVLASMIRDTLVECEGERRTVAVALNGLAGLYWLQGRLTAAERRYREVIDMGAKADADEEAGDKSRTVTLAPGPNGKPVVRVDKLLRYHAIAHYLALLDAKKARGSGDDAVPPNDDVDADDKDDGEGDAPKPPLPVPTEADLARLRATASKLASEVVGAAGALVYGEFDGLRKGSEGLLRTLHLRARADGAAAASVVPPVAAAVVDLSADGAAATSSSSSSAAGSGGSSSSAASGGAAYHRGHAVAPGALSAVLSSLAASNGPLVDVLTACAGAVLAPLKALPLDARLPSAVIDAATGSKLLSADERTEMAEAALAGGGGAIAWPLGAATKVESVVPHLTKALAELAAARARALATAAAILQPTPAEVRRNAQCKQCHSSAGRTGDVCSLCLAEAAFVAYSLQLQGFTSVQAKQGAGAQAAKRAQRASKRAVPGAAGDLASFLQQATGDNEEADAAAAAAAAAVAGAADSKSRRDKGVPTAAVRVLTALAKAAPQLKADALDVGGVLREAVKAHGGGGGGSAGSSGAGAGSSSLSAAAGARGALPPARLDVVGNDDSDDDAMTGAEVSSSAAAAVTVRVSELVPSLLEGLRAEAAALNTVWRTQMDFLSSIDELQQAAVRMELVPDSDTREIPAAEAGYRVRAYQVPELLASNKASKVAGKAGFLSRHSFLAYLVHIEAGGDDDRKCLICQDAVGAHGGVYMFTRCAHRVCVGCVQRADAKASQRDPTYGRRAITFRCPLRCKGSLMGTRVATEEEAAAAAAAGSSAAATAAAAKTPSSGAGAGAGSSAAAAADGGEDDGVEGVDFDADVVVEPGRLAALFPRPRLDAVREGGGGGAAASSASSSGGDDADAGADGAAAAAAAAPGPRLKLTREEADAALAVSGSYGTKIEALVKAVKALKLLHGSSSSGTRVAGAADASSSAAANGADPPPQCLVFSQWDEALTIADAALEANGVRCLRLGNAKKAGEVVARFVATPAITVLLLPLKSSAAGLNLTNATHAFHLEPVLDPAVRRQANGRIFRMGQARRTYAHYLVVDGSIEVTAEALAASRARQSVDTASSIAAAAAARGARAAEDDDDDGDGGGVPAPPPLHAQASAAICTLAAAQVGYHRNRVATAKRRRTGAVAGGAAGGYDGSDDDGEDDDGGGGGGFGAAGAGRDDAGITRRDVWALFTAQEEFARRLQQELGSGSGVAPATASTDAATVAAANDDAAAAAASAAAAAQAEADAAERAEASADLAAVTLEIQRNYKFWSRRVVMSGKPVVREAALTRLSWAAPGGGGGSGASSAAAVAAGDSSSSSSSAAAATAAAPETVRVFGREVRRDTAVRLLALPAVALPAPAQELAEQRGPHAEGVSGAQHKRDAAAEVRLRAAIDGEVARLRAALGVAAPGGEGSDGDNNRSNQAGT